MTTALNGKTLTTHEATIQTAQVEIRVLKVGKKQVTMGMFRQLPRRDLIDLQTLEMHGTPWGHVNYWWEGDGRTDDRATYRHVVWQQGEDLARALIPDAPPWWMREEWRVFDQNTMTDLVVLWLATPSQADLVWLTEILRQSSYRRASQTIQLGELQGTAWLEPLQWQILSDYVVWVHRHDDRPSISPERYHDLVAERRLADTTPGHVRAKLEAHRRAVHSYTTRWAAHWATIAALPQLFIAV